MSLEIWVWVKPWSLKKVNTEFGLSAPFNFTPLEAETALSGVNPHISIRYFTVNEFRFKDFRVDDGGPDDENGWIWERYSFLSINFDIGN